VRHHCRIQEGRRGICGVRENRNGVLYSLVYGRLVAEKIDPIEKKPLFNNVRLMHELGVWVEVTTLIIPGLNDSEEELRALARFIHSISPAIPWHVTAFHPTYKMMDRQATPAATLQKARKIGQEAGLRYVYEGNISGKGGENTYCPGCGTELISRFGFSISKNDLADDHCMQCGQPIDGVWS